MTTYEEAFREIATWKPGSPVFISLCGVAQGEAAIFEFGAAWDGHGRYNVVPMGNQPFLIQTNHFDERGPFAGNTKPQIVDASDAEWDAHKILATSTARKAVLKGALTDAYSRPKAFDLKAALQNAFLRRPIWNHETSQWVMMFPGTGETRIWVRSKV